MKTKKKISSITIIGRRWFQKGPGNTYHTCTVLVNGRKLCRLGKEYGYGEQYLQSAAEYLEGNGFLPEYIHYPNGGTEPLRMYCDRKNIAYYTEVIDVGREKDL